MKVRAKDLQVGDTIRLLNHTEITIKKIDRRGSIMLLIFTNNYNYKTYSYLAYEVINREEPITIDASEAPLWE